MHFLPSVRGLGTEGRLAAQGNASEEIPPNFDSVYEHVVFRAADVKDLKIDDPNPRRGPPPPLQDPAILGVSAC